MSPQLSQLSYRVLQVSYPTYRILHTDTISLSYPTIHWNQFDLFGQNLISAMGCDLIPLYLQHACRETTSFSGIWNGSNPIIFTILPRKPDYRGEWRGIKPQCDTALRNCITVIWPFLACWYIYQQSPVVYLPNRPLIFIIGFFL